jgi:hypothetical protein
VNEQGRQIIARLQAVADERRRRAADPAFGERVQAVKHWQHARFERTYADILASPRYGDAARFFLDDLYGPTDFTNRDTQFARIVPGLVRVFPAEIVATVATLAELHALSEQFDSAMAAALPAGVLDALRYGVAWRAVGRPDDRERQIRLMLRVGEALDRFTRSALLRHTLRLMRGPAHAAGLETLQAFLERGFDTFRAMKGAQPFLDTIAERERRLAAALFAGDDVALAATGAPAGGAEDSTVAVQAGPAANAAGSGGEPA